LRRKERKLVRKLLVWWHTRAIEIQNAVTKVATMKSRTNHLKTTLLLTGTLALGLTTLPGDSFGGKGTDILHFFDRKVMSNPGVIPDAQAYVDVRQNEQGKVNLQTVDVYARGLAAGTKYQLWASLLDDPKYTQAGEFATDSRGRAVLHYRKLEFANGKVQTPGRWRLPLPSALEPTSKVRRMEIRDENAVVVLSADLAKPDRLSFLVKRDIGTDTVPATMRVFGNTRAMQFRLLASKMYPETDYWLMFNGTRVQTNTTDERGRLYIRSVAENPVGVLDLRSVELWDTNSVKVLGTPMP
jgi:hypothetical protein